MARLNCGWPILCQCLQLKTFLKMRTRFWSCSPGREHDGLALYRRVPTIVATTLGNRRFASGIRHSTINGKNDSRHASHHAFIRY